jgi:flavin reductase (DIM6/NTAB) family NADH-FMN oxidoreductase RutF
VDSGTFRQIVGSFPTGVTVLTTAVEGRFHGITVNSLTSVSLDPLLVLVCIERRAHAHAEIERGMQFGLSFLEAGQEASSRLFALTLPPEGGHLRVASFHLSPHGVPILDGAVAWLECGVQARYPGGDHTIFLSSVVDGNVHHDRQPLVYFRGRYRHLAE